MRERNKYAPDGIVKIIDRVHSFYLFCSNSIGTHGLGQAQNPPGINKALARDYVRAYQEFKEKVPKNIRDSLIRNSKTLREYINLGSVLEKGMEDESK